MLTILRALGFNDIRTAHDERDHKKGPPFRSSPSDRRPEAIMLEPARDVVLVDGGFLATSNEPWLRIERQGPPMGGRWIELVYDASILEPVARPILRCLTGDGERDHILPGPIFGRAIWFGFIPAGAREIWISPTDHEGAFCFRVTSVRTLNLFELISRSQRPTHTLETIFRSVLGNVSGAERPLRRTLMSTPIERYAEWRDRRRRPLEWSGLDAMGDFNKGQGLHIRVVAPGADEAEIARWLSVLHGQPWPNWSFAAPLEDQVEPTAQVRRLASQTKLSLALADLHGSDLLVVAGRGDLWAPEALAIAGSTAQRGRYDIFYGDEELIGSRIKPLFKPDWGPIAGQSLDLIGRAWFARVDWARAMLGEKPVAEIPSLAIRPGSGARVKHIARVLLSRNESAPSSPPIIVAPPPPRLVAKPSATIVIPIRDRIDLLRQCVAGLNRTQSDFEAIIVDNGSVEDATHEFLADLVRNPRYRVLARPGPFNFAALCNDAAREARASTLLFLNNDTEARSSDWLERLIAWTPLPNIGAVGAKLLFPNGRLQHAGVIVGIDGHANHFELKAGPNGSGYFGRFLVPHELSAVTGACLAVEKAKFDAVGGFDAENLPVEFNDIDLCLRLFERGWTSLLEPRSVLIHHQAATRKVSRDQEQRYAAEVSYFKNRWRHRLRADPFFHPALSLDWQSPALG